MIRVLIVEDHHAIAAGLKDNLEIEGYEVRVASDGVAAIQLAQAWDPTWWCSTSCCRSGTVSKCWPPFEPVETRCR